MLRFSLIVTCFVTLWSQPLFASDIKGMFSCKAVSVSLTEMQDGRAKKFSGYEGGLKKGSEVSFHYEFDTIRNRITMREIRSNDDLAGYASGNFKRPLRVEGYYQTQRNNIALSESEIYADLLPAELHLNRYYKNDWQGLYTFVLKNSILVAGFDCRHPKDVLDLIFEHLKSKGFRKE